MTKWGQVGRVHALANRVGASARRRAGESYVGRALGSGEVIYLIAPTGYPNYGDELIAGTWLRHLARVRPQATVILDCHSPGSASALMGDAHPNLLVVDTLWQLTNYAADSDTEPDAPWSWVARAVLDSGLAPRLTAGIDLLHSATTIHLLGGGYVNTVWPHHVSLLVAAATISGRTGAKVVATGQGLVPTVDEPAWTAMVTALGAFDIVDVRDTASAEALDGGVGARHSGDDAWLALHRPQQAIYRDEGPADTPGHGSGVVLCLQSDLTEKFTGPGGSGVDALAAFVNDTLDAWEVPGSAVTVIEGIPGHDYEVPFRLGSRLDGARILNFRDVWRDGLPAGQGNTWISTRFHPHLIAAAAGDSGVAIVPMPVYYSTKHRSLVEAGSAWAVADSGYTIPDRPTAGGFGTAHRERAIDAKVATALDIYPVAALFAYRA
ncbi:polysaccharide pyruvyl transferase family protein [Gordonia westfalica]|uniref:Polysaccharide pyruvyl transferase family protein n=1 Tax=Gordonia westfalica TaxID=158898 RepID=A0ABU2GVK9_9ACTN|nr:polysaccharide pyruvyl transferase family protein [Gordonia westfalica]MDS1115060.1 polysaccharide pyruvyl transferase family protein [Gordonia westfalica]